MRDCDELRGVPANLAQFTPDAQSQIVVSAYVQAAEAYSICLQRHAVLVEWIESEE